MKSKTESLLTWKTDDPDTSAPVVQPVPPSPLPQNRIYGEREPVVVHERSVRPRLSSCPKRMSCLRQIQEHFSDHGFVGIGIYTVFANSVGENVKQVWTSPSGDGSFDSGSSKGRDWQRSPSSMTS